MGDILFLAHRIPFPPDRGDKIRANHLLKYLSDLAPVHIGTFWETAHDRGAEPEMAALAKSHCLIRRSKPLPLAGVEAVLSGKPVSLTAFHSRKLEDWVEQTIAKHEIGTIFIFSGQMGQYIPEGFAGQVIIDLCDVDSAKFDDYADAGERVWLNRREGRLLGEEEERLAHRADTTLLISENEKNLFLRRLRNAAGTRIKAVGNGIDAGFFNPAKVAEQAQISESAGPNLVFTGQMDYRPNEEAALWAIEQFMPAARQVFPSLELHIVGRNPTERLRSHNDVPGVTVWGEVPDVRPFLKAAGIGFVPLAIARGVQNKVLEAMAMELPVLLSPHAATGIDAQDGRDWFIAERDVPVMVKRLSRILADERVLAAAGKSSRQFVLENHSWKAMLAPLDAMVSNPVDKRDVA